MYSHCFRMSGRWDIISSSCAGLQSLPDKFWAVEHVLFRISMFCRELLRKIARRNSGVFSRNSGVISRNSGVISRNSGVISRNSGVFCWTQSF